MKVSELTPDEQRNFEYNVRNGLEKLQQVKVVENLLEGIITEDDPISSFSWYGYGDKSVQLSFSLAREATPEVSAQFIYKVRKHFGATFRKELNQYSGAFSYSGDITTDNGIKVSLNISRYNEENCVLKKVVKMVEQTTYESECS